MNSKKSSGFTLVEVVIVLLIGGILLGSFGSGLLIYFNSTKVAASKDKLSRINETLVEYLAINQKLPCPADITATVDSASFGREVDAVPVSVVACNAGGSRNGTVVVNGARNVNGGAQEVIRIGSVPTRALNLPDEFMYDSYGSRFLYAVSADLATTAGYAPEDGVIDVTDSGGNTLLTPTASANYVIISHGPDQQGGVTVDGVVIEACPATAAAGGFDVENCDGDATFLRTILSTSNLGATQFDDQILYNSFDAEINVPSSAVMGFQLASCPDGWSPWAPAVGRFVIGAGNAGAIPQSNPNGTATWNDPAVNYGLSTTGGQRTYQMVESEIPLHDHTVSLGIYQSTTPGAANNVVGGGNSGTIVNASNIANDTLQAGGLDRIQTVPPYVALLYCIKN